MSLGQFRRNHPVFFWGVGLAVVGALAIDGWVVRNRLRYQEEIERLRANMTDVERQRTDAIMNADQHRTAVMLELIRRQAKVDPEVHLAVSVDSGYMRLGSAGALLREFDVSIGPERQIGSSADTVRLAVPRGKRSVARVLGRTDAWEVPAWVYEARGLPVPEDRVVRGALGPSAILLDGGTIIYSPPAEGPLADSAWVLPGAVRVAAADLAAVVPNLRPGRAVYFY